MKFRLVLSKSNHHYRHLKSRLFVQMHGENDDKTKAWVEKVIAINMRRVVAYLGIAAFGAYLALVTTVFFFLREPSNRRVSWWNVAAPWKWTQSRQIIAEESVSRGLACLKTHRYAEGIMQIESGLRRAPWMNEGRIELARFYIAALMPTRAIQLLDAGRSYVAADPRALELAAVAGFFTEDYDFVLRYCDSVISFVPRESVVAVEATARTYRISALLGAGRVEEAVSYASTIKSPANVAQAETIARAFVEARQYGPAMQRIDAALARYPEEAAIAGLRARVRREMNDLPTLVRELNELSSRNRTNPSAQIMCVRELWQAGLKDDAFKALDRYFRYFDAQPANIIQAARVLVQLPQADPLIEACLARAKELGQRQEPLWVALTELRLLAGDLQGMRPWLEKLRDSKTKDPAAKSWLDVMSNLLATSDEENKAYADRLLESLKMLRVPPSVLATIVMSLRDANKPLAAATVANYGRLVFPNNARIAKVTQSVKALDAQMDQPNMAAPAPVACVEESEIGFFKRLDLMMEGMRWTDANRLIIETRRDQPDWFRRREKDLILAEMRIASLTDDSLKLQSIMRSFLQGDLTRRNEAFQFALMLKSEGKFSQEEIVLREILAKQPDDAVAKKRLKELKEGKDQKSEVIGNSP
ncbi:MAG: hypothetical protein WC378_09660 [Opitutaceae bacterium]